MENSRTKKLVIVAMMAALAYIVMILIKIPMLVDYLKYDPKDVIIAVTGFLFGPLEALVTALVVCVIEAFTVGTTGWIGAVMNFLASCSFAVVASLVYRRKRTLPGAVAGLVCGVVCLTVMMLLWNYFLTPVYTGMPRETVAAMLPTVFLPFNLIKGGINAALTMLIYKPVVITLRRTGLVPAGRSLSSGQDDARPASSGAGSRSSDRISPLVMIAAAVVLALCIAVAVILTKA